MNATLAALTGRAWALEGRLLAGLVDDLRAGRQPLVAALPARALSGPPPPAGVGVLPLFGPLEYRPGLLAALLGTGTGLAEWGIAFRRLLADRTVGAIVIPIDSPGGSIDGVPETAALVREGRRTKPVVAVVDTLAASAAYWIAAQASEVVITPSGSVGSIGVYVAHVDQSALEAQVGLKVTLISAGKYKVEGNPHEPLSPAARDYAQGIVDTWYRRFVEEVAAGRRTTPARVAAKFGEGRLLLQLDAMVVGMADRRATLDVVLGEVVAEAAKARFDAEMEVHRHRAAALGGARAK